MKKILVLLALLALLVASATQAAPPVVTGEIGVAEPWAYDPDGTDTIVAEWNDDGDILILQKNAPTSTNSAAGASLLEADGEPLEFISFEVRGYCNNGAPRFNVYHGDSWETYTTGFFGCARSLDSELLGDGWTRVNFNCDSEEGVPDEATGCGLNILGIEIVMDEEGQTDLRNIVVNGTLYLAAGDTPVTETTQPPPVNRNRTGYCMPQPVLRQDGTMGRFVDLLSGQPANDPVWAGAKVAYYVEGIGIACEIPQGYFLDGTSVGVYPFARKA
jgi:hypothetical protein